MTSIHDNPERGRLIIRAMRECVAVGDDPSMQNMADKLPPDFDLLSSEVSEALAELAGVSDELPLDSPDGAAVDGDGGDAIGSGDFRRRPPLPLHRSHKLVPVRSSSKHTSGSVTHASPLRLRRNGTASQRRSRQRHHGAPNKRRWQCRTASGT